MAMKFHFTDERRGVLREYYTNRGITSVSARNSGIIDQIASEIGVTSVRVSAPLPLSVFETGLITVVATAVKSLGTP